MRLRASFWVLGAALRLASPAALPRSDDVSQSSCSDTLEEPSTAASVITLTVAPEVVGTTCTTDGVLPIQITDSAATTSGNGIGSVTPSCTFESGPGSATLISSNKATESPAQPTTTVAIPVLTVTVPISSESSTGFVTALGHSDSEAAATVAPWSIPDITLTVTIPQTPESSTDSVITVTLYSSSYTPVKTTQNPAATAASGPSASHLSWFSSSTSTTAVPVPLPTSQMSDPGAPFTVTYTLSPEPGFPAPFTGTITITPVSLSPGSATESFGSGDPSTPRAMTVTTASLATGSFASPSESLTASVFPFTVASPVAVSTYTVTAPGNPAAIPSIVTVTIGASASSPVFSQPSLITLTETISPVPVVPVTVPLSVPPSSSDDRHTTLESSGVASTLQRTDYEDDLTSSIPDSVLTITVSAPAGYSTSTPATGTSQNTITITLPAITTTVPGFPGLGTEISESVFTITISGGTGPSFSQSSKTNTDFTEVITVTRTAGSSTPTPSSPTSPWFGPSDSWTASVVLVTYTVPAEPGVDRTSYVVTYPLQTTDTGSNATPTQSDASSAQIPKPSTIKTATVGSGSAGTSNSLEPVTITVTPANASGSPVTVTWTPGEPWTPDTSTTTAIVSSNSVSTVTVIVPASTAAAGDPYFDSAYGGDEGLTHYDGDAVTPTAVEATPSGSVVVITVLETATETNASDATSRTLVSPTPVDGSTLSIVTVTLSPGSEDKGSMTTLASAPNIVTVTEEVFPSAEVNRSTNAPAIITATTDSDPVPILGNPYGPPVATDDESPLTPTAAESTTSELKTVSTTSGSPVPITISGDTYGGGFGPDLSTSRSMPSLLPITDSSLMVSGTSDTPTIVVSDITLSQTVSLGPGYSTVVEFSTQLTMITGSNPSTTPVSTALVSPVIATFTVSDAYGQVPNVPTYTTNLPVWSTAPTAETPTAPGPVTTWQSMQSPEIITIWPPSSSSCSSPSSKLIGPEPESTTDAALPWQTTTQHSSGSSLAPPTGVSSCTSEESTTVQAADPAATQSDNPVPSEVSIWPPPCGVNYTCITLLTSYRSSSTAISMTPSGSCTETLPEAFPGSTSFVTTNSGPVSAPPPVVLSEVVAPSDTELHHPTQAATDASAASRTAFGGYVFSTPDVGYGYPAPKSSASSSVSSIEPVFTTDTALPFSQAATVSPPPRVTASNLTTGSNTLTTIVPPLWSSVQEPNATLVTQPDVASATRAPEGSTVVASSVNASSIVATSVGSGSPSMISATLTSVPSSAAVNLTSLSSSLASVITPGMSPPNASQPAQGVTFSTSISLPIPPTTGNASVSLSPSIIDTIRKTATDTWASTLVLGTRTPPPFPYTTSTARGNDTASTATTNLNNSIPLPTSDILPTTTTGTTSSAVRNATTPLAPIISNTRLPSQSPFPFDAVTCGSKGDRGEVVFGFDDIPAFAVDKEANSNAVGPQPMPFRYHRFFFSSGFSVVPPLASKYQPSSGTQMLEHNFSFSPVAQVGVGQLRGNPCFRFNFQGISLGCDSTDAPCIFDIVALRWNGNKEVVHGRERLEVAACADSFICNLSHQTINAAVAASFSNLTAVNITLVTTGNTQTWWADDLQIAWTDNDCTVAECRSKVPNKIMASHSPKAPVGRAKRESRWAVRG